MIRVVSRIARRYAPREPKCLTFSTSSRCTLTMSISAESGFGMKSTAPASSARSVVSAPSRVSALTMMIGGPRRVDDRARGFQPADPRHLDVHRDDVGPQPLDHRDSLFARRRGADDANLRLLLEHLLDRAAHERGVVDHDDGDGVRVHAGTAALSR